MDFAPLLAPVTDAQPCGADLSFSSEFDAIAEDRRADDPTLDQGEWKTQIKTADWARVEARCTLLLASRTKDLRLLAWLTEAMTHRRGFAGMADGLSLCAQSCQAFWPHLHPLPDGGDQEQRIGNLTWLLANVVTLSHGRPVVDAGAGRRYTLREVEAARTRSAENGADLHDLSSSAPQGAGALTIEALTRAQQDTPAGFFRDNLAQARRALAALLQLQLVVDAHLGADGPGFAGARAALDDVIHAADRLARDTGAEEDAGQGPSPGAGIDGSRTDPSLAPARFQDQGRGPSNEAALLPRLQTREQALQQLRLVADYFRRTEPHSPVAYLADKAVRWGNMPLHEWLRTVLKDGGNLAHVEELLGITTSSSPADG